MRQNLLHAPDLWNVYLDSSDSRPSRESFTEVVETFALDIEDAFSAADRSMTVEETELRERYLEMREFLKQARQHTNLSSCDHQRLDEELKKFDTNRSRVKNSLIAHHRWQEAHDKLHELDSVRETSSFEKKLVRYSDTSLSKLLDLVNREIDPSYVHQAGTTEPEREAVAMVFQNAPQPSLSGFQQGALDDLLRLKESLDELRLGGGAEAFDKIGRPFNDVFYAVDKRTLEEINRAGKRAANLEGWLQELSIGPWKTD